MSNKVFAAIIALIVIGAVGFTVVSKKQNPPAERPGTELPDNGREHLTADEKISYGGPEPPASGKHGQPLPWQVYDQEIPDENSIHNLEHGGIYISYSPDLPQEQIDKIKALFSPPYSREGFSPTKAIVAPRAANESPIILTSWLRNLKLDSYDEETIVNYYLQNIGKSPEPTAS